MSGGAANDEARDGEDTAQLDAPLQRALFLLKLADALCSQGDPTRIHTAASCLLAEHLGADCVYCCKVEGPPGARDALVRGHYARSGAPFPPRLSDWTSDEGRTSLLFPRDAPLVVADASHEPGVPEGTRASWRALGVAALISVVLVKNGREALQVGVLHDKPRQWSPADVDLVHEFAERTWAATERARADAALRESEQRYRRLLEGIDEGFCRVEVLFDGDGNAAGRVMLVGGIGHDLTGLRETELRLQTLMEGIPQLVWRADVCGHRTWSSAQWVAFTGCSVEESQGFG